MVRKIVEKTPDSVVQQDLERYRQMALELGGTDAKIITTDKILIDDRVRAKCVYPKCAGYGTNMNCPPHAMDLDQIRKIVNNFQYAIITKLEVPSEQLAGPGVRDKRSGIPTQIKNHEIVAKIEAEAYYDGYYFALGFANGCCKFAYCHDVPCVALEPGKPCRQSLKARSSMEAVGMDAFGMAARMGWDIYPLGARVLPDEVPCGMRLGLVLIY